MPDVGSSSTPVMPSPAAAVDELALAARFFNVVLPWADGGVPRATLIMVEVWSVGGEVERASLLEGGDEVEGKMEKVGGGEDEEGVKDGKLREGDEAKVLPVTASKSVLLACAATCSAVVNSFSCIIDSLGTGAGRARRG